MQEFNRQGIRETETATGQFRSVRCAYVMGSCRMCSKPFEKHQQRVGPVVTAPSFGRDIEVTVSMCTSCFCNAYRGKSVTILDLEKLSTEEQELLAQLGPIKKGLEDAAKKRRGQVARLAGGSEKGKKRRKSKGRNDPLKGSRQKFSSFIIVAPSLLDICDLRVKTERNDALADLLPLLARA